jgi:nicotinate phosphoribosyltransferase
VWGEKALAHYERLRIDPTPSGWCSRTGSTCPRRSSLYRHFADRTQLGFGIGTNLSNDMGPDAAHRDEADPLQRPAGGQALRQPGQDLCDDQTFLAYLRQVFNVPPEERSVPHA